MSRDGAVSHEDPCLSPYFRELAECESLPPREEASLSSRAKKGDRQALDVLVKANLRFVITVAKHYQHHGLPLTDLISEGNRGLLQAAMRFDETRNCKFISYAVWWVRQSILKALAEQSRIVAVPLGRVCVFYKIARVEKELGQKLGRPPYAEEIADELSLDPDDIDETRTACAEHYSMDAPIDTQDDSTLHDVLFDQKESAEDEILADSLHNEVHKALAVLDDRERRVVELYYGIGESSACTLKEIGQACQLTGERVRQLKQTALTKLRRYYGAVRGRRIGHVGYSFTAHAANMAPMESKAA